MDFLKAILLGVLQGATEFLPISSSAHLVAAQALLRQPPTGTDVPTAPEELVLAVALHFGTLLAILVVFRRELLRLVADGLTGAAVVAQGRGLAAARERAPMFYLALAIVVGTIPAGVVGLLFEDAFDAAFKNLTAAGAFLICTGLLLLASRLARPPRTDAVTPAKGFLIGLAQAAALLPGISRSGSTIVAGYFTGLERDAAARFSFLLAVPALLGAAILKSCDLFDGATGGVSLGAVACGTLAAALVGGACLVALLKVVARGRLHWFAAYCLPVGALMLVAGLLR
jgi:undecaprenyl-diphosphatase